jgi:(E)-4-hydroxy-3-methylbut-2-enyl-diphosphate synthase
MEYILPYCRDPFHYHRRKTREVKVGTIGIGGDNSIRIQSMTNSDTQDTAATVRQVLALAKAGCEMVRITAPAIKDAENLRNIRNELRRRRCAVPLVADIHFLPQAAMVAAEYVEKVRINPGNYADKKKFLNRQYTEAEYQAELERVDDAFRPLVLRCKELGRAMRIGVNHGSLSDRIMSRFGDTPQGMVESAIEFIRICEKYDYREIVVSMKSSNVKLVIQAYRLLAARMAELDMDYPFHLGVTEAGDSEDGRVKSAVGMGALLEDGIGDTVRVSLTEDSVNEIPVCRALVKPYHRRQAPPLHEGCGLSFTEKRNPYSYSRRQTREVHVGDVAVGGRQDIRVEIPVRLRGLRIEEKIRMLLAGEVRAEILQLAVGSSRDCRAATELMSKFPGRTFAIDIGCRPQLMEELAESPPSKLIFELSSEWLAHDHLHNLLLLAREQGFAVQVNLTEAHFLEAKKFFDLAQSMRIDRVLAGIGTRKILGVTGAFRLLAAFLESEQINWPIQLSAEGGFRKELDALTGISTQLGVLLCDGIGDSIQVGDGQDPFAALRLAYNILQATGNRITKTEYITCPSCGRTLFKLQPVVERIKARTSHLKGVKIAVMGCIVNGPGEMADADFGYVGGAPGKVNLYVGKECVEVHVPESEAEDRLIELIKRHGKWREPGTVGRE